MQHRTVPEAVPQVLCEQHPQVPYTGSYLAIGWEGTYMYGCFHLSLIVWAHYVVLYAWLVALADIGLSLACCSLNHDFTRQAIIPKFRPGIVGIQPLLCAGSFSSFNSSCLIKLTCILIEQ